VQDQCNRPPITCLTSFDLVISSLRSEPDKKLKRFSSSLPPLRNNIYINLLQQNNIFLI